MKQTQGKPTVVSASVTMFAYLQEKVGERKTKIEAYCDLLDKASAGFVSPFLKKNEQLLEACQCHVTITDLSESWHWHRATVRSFLEKLEEFGQLIMERLPKSYIITMPASADEGSSLFGSRESRFSRSANAVLSKWLVDEMSSEDAGKEIGRLVGEAKQRLAKSKPAEQSEDSGTNQTDDAKSSEQPEDTAEQENTDSIEREAYSLIVKATFCKAILSMDEKDFAPLYDFFENDLDNDWPSVIEASKTLSELVLNGSSSSLDFESKQAKARFQTLVEPFKAALAKSMAKSSGSKAEKPIV